MDESWRMRMGTSNGRNRSRGSISDTGLEPDDFEDVFGGPPRSVMARKLSVDFSSSEWFYHEVFKDSDTVGPLTEEGQRLPEFMIPEQRQSKTKVKSWMSKSKSTSSSVLSFEELSHFGAPGLITGEENAALSSFTSRLRPINVPYRWSSTSTSNMLTCKSEKKDLPAFGSNKSTYIDKNNQLKGNEYIINNCIFGFPQPVPSPEILVDNHLGPQQSPSSALSSHLQEHQPRNLTNFLYEESISYHKHVKVDDDDDEEVMSSSYIIELNSHSTEANNSEAVDEAIAWAKEQFQG